MKLSEIINAISNNEVVDDRENPETVDVLFFVQDAKDIHNVCVVGYLDGDRERMAKMIASRMYKNEDFRDMMSKAAEYYVCRVLKDKLNAEKVGNETAEE